jgi:hypothetical protein
MSANIRLFPCVNRDSYYSDTVLELNSWCTWALASVVPNAKPITKPVRVHWVDNMETREPCHIDTDNTWLIEARFLKPLRFHKDSWHESNIVASKAISAYLNQLPDDWPVIVYYI